MKRSALLVASILLLTACSAGPAATDDTIRVVASTNVYGDIANTIGGDHVSVTSLIASAAQDPHSFEASAQDQLAVSKADVIIENGGGYDEFMGKLIGSSGGEAKRLDVFADFTATMDVTDGFNEHLWYNFEAMKQFADNLATTLGGLDAAHADVFRQNSTDLVAQLDTLALQAAALGSGQAVAVTEPVPIYLLEAAGLVNRTPAEFTEAIEEGSDVPPLALQQTLALLENGSVVLLAYNDQTASPETERVRAAAYAADIPVVSFSETLPEGETYITWMTATLNAIASALR